MTQLSGRHLAPLLVAWSHARHAYVARAPGVPSALAIEDKAEPDQAIRRLAGALDALFGTDPSAFADARPVALPEHHAVVTLPPVIHQRIEQLAKRHRLSVNEFLAYHLITAFGLGDDATAQTPSPGATGAPAGDPTGQGPVPTKRISLAELEALDARTVNEDHAAS